MRIAGHGCKSRWRSIAWRSVSQGRRTWWPHSSVAASPGNPERMAELRIDLRPAGPGCDQLDLAGSLTDLVVD